VSRSRSVLLNIARYTTTNATYVASGVSASEKREWPRRGGYGPTRDAQPASSHLREIGQGSAPFGRSTAYLD
jgi:hypothetical protein